MKLAVAIGLVLSIFAAPLYAQESLGGKYSGTIMFPTKQGELLAPVVLEIMSVEDGKVKAKAYRGPVGNSGPPMTCGGNYQMEGTYANNKLVIKSVSGPLSDCVLNFVLVAEGNKLKGTVGKREVELSK
jgi:hypothetical protein